MDAIRNYEKERTFYVLRKQGAFGQDYPLHSGPVHLRFVFPNA